MAPQSPSHPIEFATVQIPCGGGGGILLGETVVLLLRHIDNDDNNIRTLMIDGWIGRLMGDDDKNDDINND